MLVQPTAGGLACAVGAVVAGAPIFSEGLRALRLRRHISGIAETPVSEGLAGFVHVSGPVALESPLFGPLSASRCAGFQLEVQVVGSRVRRTIEVRRPFRLGARGSALHVTSSGGHWALSATAVREIGPGQPLSESLEHLLAQAPQARWWRRAGGTLRFTERALRADAVCHVIGFARRARPLELPGDLMLLRTGTGTSVELAETAAAGQPGLWLGPGEYLDFMLVLDRPPTGADLALPAWRTLGVVVGPALSLAGILYLAAAAESLRALARF